MMTKQIVWRVFFFCFFLFILLVFFSWLFIPKNSDKRSGMYNANAYGVLGLEKNTLDVLVIGDSEAYANISPLNIYQDHGITMYIAGTPGQLINVSYDFLKQTLKTQRPKVVILEANNIFRKVSVERMLKNTAKNILPVFYYHNRWKSLTLRDWNFTIDYTWYDELRGYNFNRKVKSAKNDDYMNKKKTGEKITTINYYYLEKIRKLCLEEGITFMLLNTPNHKNWSLEKHNLVSEYASEHHIDYLDMNMINDEIGIDWLEDTRDHGDHLNYSGAFKVSKYLGNYLVSKMDFISHRGDEKYMSWEKDLEKFIKKVQSRKQLHNYDHD